MLELGQTGLAANDDGDLLANGKLLDDLKVDGEVPVLLCAFDGVCEFSSDLGRGRLVEGVGVRGVEKRGWLYFRVLCWDGWTRSVRGRLRNLASDGFGIRGGETGSDFEVRPMVSFGVRRRCPELEK